MVFITNNQNFTCRNCNKIVSKHPSSSRDHCPYCLIGLHVDIYPGDRANECCGILEPIGIRSVGQKIQIVYHCNICKQRVNNVIALDDNHDLIQKLSTIPVT